MSPVSLDLLLGQWSILYFVLRFPENQVLTAPGKVAQYLIFREIFFLLLLRCSVCQDRVVSEVTPASECCVHLGRGWQCREWWQWWLPDWDRLGQSERPTVQLQPSLSVGLSLLLLSETGAVRITEPAQRDHHSQ